MSGLTIDDFADTPKKHKKLLRMRAKRKALSRLIYWRGELVKAEANLNQPFMSNPHTQWTQKQSALVWGKARRRKKIRKRIKQSEERIRTL